MLCDLNAENFLLYAARNYASPHYIESEFFDDLKKIKYIKILFRKYKNSGNMNDRLILNHLIMVYNVFETEACTRMLFYRLDDYHKELKTFLVYLNFMPDVIKSINGSDILSSDIFIDIDIANKLRQI